MLEYFNTKRARSKSPIPQSTTKEAPVLSEEDEAFLHRIAEEGTPPELPERPAPPLPQRPQNLPEAGNTQDNNAQIALMDGAQRVPLPDETKSPEISPCHAGEGLNSIDHTRVEEVGKTGKRSKWSFLRRDSRDTKRKATATDLMSAAENLKSADAQLNDEGQVSDPEVQREEAEMTSVLEDLNLAAVNNRVFSISKESQELLHKFTLVLKDLINGVPTAYGDLESLLTNSENQLQRSYTHLPPWLQKLVEQLPKNMTKSVGPEMLAAAAEKHGINTKYANMAAHGAEKAGLRVRVPSLKDLVTKPGAVAAMLKAIMNFLKLRFPAFLGMNVLYSLALFILLFVFWYCHKRGKEVRLEKERLLTEEEISHLDDEASAGSSAAPRTTTAPSGASIADVQNGMLILENDASTDAQSSRTGYAEGGSLSRYEQGIAKDKRAEIDIREIDVDLRSTNSSKSLKQQQRKLGNRVSKSARWRMQPSKADLSSQESCVML